MYTHFNITQRLDKWKKKKKGQKKIKSLVTSQKKSAKNKPAKTNCKCFTFSC